MLKATSDTVAGNYDVVVTTTGQRAVGEGTAVQTAALAADETLVINGVTVTLAAGLSKAGVISRINEFTAQTGVVADANGTGTRTRLYTEEFGSDAELSVISNTAAAATSSGIGVVEVTDTGVDIIGTIGGTSFTGSGNVLTATSGNATGLKLEIAANTGTTPTRP